MYRNLFNSVIGILFICFSYSITIDEYEVNLLEGNNLLNIKKTIQNDNLSEQLNNKYLIDVDYLLEIGLHPFSIFYMVEHNKEYSIDYNIISSYQLENIDISFEGDFMDENFILSESMIMRGVELSQISFFPIEYNDENQTLTIIEEVEINILETDIDNPIDDEVFIVPISKEFEKLFSNLVINLDLGSRTTDSQPSILYICGGNSLDNSYLQDLIQWRSEQGYKVFTANPSDIGSSFSSVSNYISDA